MLRALLTTPFFLMFIAGPLAVLGALYLWMHARLGRGRGIASRATNHAMVASWLSLLWFTVWLVQQIVLSDQGTAVFSLIMIPPTGLTLAAFVFVIAWALSVVVQSTVVRRPHEPREAWSLALASSIVVVAGIVVLAGAYRDHLVRQARTETAPDALRAIHTRDWARRDWRILAAIARNTHTPPDVLATLARNPDVAAVVARNEATPPEALEQLYARSDMRAHLAVNPSTPPSILGKLATDDRHEVRMNLLWNRNLPADVFDTLARDPEVGEMMVESQRLHALHRWFLMSPPYTWRWRRPLTRVLDDDAPPEAWHPTMGFDTEEACEALRTEFVRRSSNPARRWRNFEGDQPHDFYAHTRCAPVEPGRGDRGDHP